MSKIINGGLDQYGAESFKQQQLEQLALKATFSALSLVIYGVLRLQFSW